MGRQNVSIQTTMSRAGAADADRRWRGHKAGCPRCSTAQRRRQPGQMCAQGAAAYAAMKDCAARLAQERELDKHPMPGQGELF